MTTRAAVSELAWDVAALLMAAGDALAARFGAVVVRGEISGFTRAASGHCYFSLKDRNGQAAVLRCAMFRRAAGLLSFAPRDGQQVELRGRVAVFEARGELQCVVEAMMPLGQGALYEQFLRLKAQLAAQGLFDAGRKRPIPAWPRRVGVVSSLAAAALADVLTALRRRSPQVGVVVYPSAVQGADAPVQLVQAIELANARAEVDVLLLCRGGGSLEDLWSFNDERVVRAVAASALPVVCGVGHETDVTLADLAADLRAATPTAAAELAAPHRIEALATLGGLAARRTQALLRRLDREGQRLDLVATRLSARGAGLAAHRARLQALETRSQVAVDRRLERMRRQQEGLAARLPDAVERALERRRNHTQGLADRLRLLDPAHVLRRGFALVYDDAGRAVASAAAAPAAGDLQVAWHDGHRAVRVLTPPGGAS